jgi:hypothetical protein
VAGLVDKVVVVVVFGGADGVFEAVVVVVVVVVDRLVVVVVVDRVVGRTVVVAGQKVAATRTTSLNGRHVDGIPAASSSGSTTQTFKRKCFIFLDDSSAFGCGYIHKHGTFV